MRFINFSIIFSTLLGIISLNLSHAKALQGNCIYVEQSPENITLQGQVVFSTSNSPEFRLWSIGEDLEQITRLPFSVIEWQINTTPAVETYRIPRVSPDGSLIAYSTSYYGAELNNSVHFVWSVEEQRINASYPWQEDWIHFIGWLDDNEQAFLAQDGAISIEVVDIMGQLLRTIPLDNLDFTVNTTPWDIFNFDIYFVLWTALSAQDVMLFWLRARDMEDTSDISRLRIFNIFTGETYFTLDGRDASSITTDHRLRSPYFPPMWSHQGDQLATMAMPNSLSRTRNLFLFSVDTGFQQITFFEINESMEGFSVHSPTWSRDDRYIAFWLVSSRDGTSNPSELYLYDTENSELMLTGITSRPQNLLWSPYANILAYIEFLDDGSTNLSTNLMLADVENCTLTRLNNYANSLRFNELYDWFLVNAE